MQRSSPSTHRIRAGLVAGLACACAAVLAASNAQAQPITLAPVQIAPPPANPPAPPLAPPLLPSAPLEISSNDASITLHFHATNNLPIHMQPRGSDPLAPCTAPCRRAVAREQSAYVHSPSARPSEGFWLSSATSRLVVEAASSEQYSNLAGLRIAGGVIAGVGLNAFIVGLAYSPLLFTPSTSSLAPLRTASIVLLAAGGAFLIGGAVIAMYAHVNLGSVQTRVFDQDRRRLARYGVRWIGDGIAF